MTHSQHLVSSWSSQTSGQKKLETATARSRTQKETPSFASASCLSASGQNWRIPLDASHISPHQPWAQIGIWGVESLQPPSSSLPQALAVITSHPSASWNPSCPAATSMVHMGTSMLKKHQVPPLFKAAKFRVYLDA